MDQRIAGQDEGGIDAERTTRRDYFDAIVARSLTRIEPVVDWISDIEGEAGVVRLSGRDFSPDTRVLIDGEACEATFQGPDVIDVWVPEHLSRFGSVVATSQRPARRYGTDREAAAPAPVTLLGVAPSVAPPLQTGRSFDLVCRFRADPDTNKTIRTLSVRRSGNNSNRMVAKQLKPELH